MYATYGKRKYRGVMVALDPDAYGGIHPPTPEKVVSDRFSRCLGCPYPRHGLFCWTDSETCLRTEMAEIENRSRSRLEALPI